MQKSLENGLNIEKKSSFTKTLESFECSEGVKKKKYIGASNYQLVKVTDVRY